MPKRLMLLKLMIPLLAIPAFSFDKQKPDAKTSKKPAALTKEEKEILKNREILENLDLLQNFEKVQYLDFLTDKKANRTQAPAKQPGKDK